jgi:hypothetical protein
MAGGVPCWARALEADTRNAMIRQSDAIRRKKRFLLFRSLLIFATCAVGVLQLRPASVVAVIIVVAVALLSNVYVLMMDPFSFYDSATESLFLVIDTFMIFTILLVSNAGQSYLLPFFIVLLMTATIENVVLLALASAGLALGSMLFGSTAGGLASSAFGRVVFLVTTGLYYWFIVLTERRKEEAHPVPLSPEAPAPE